MDDGVRTDVYRVVQVKVVRFDYGSDWGKKGVRTDVYRVDQVKVSAIIVVVAGAKIRRPHLCKKKVYVLMCI